MKMITETEIMNFMYLDNGMKNVETIISQLNTKQLMQFFLEYVVVQTLAKLSKRNQAMFNDEYKSFQKQVKRMTYWKL